MFDEATTIECLKKLCGETVELPPVFSRCDKILKCLIDGTHTDCKVFRGIGVASSDKDYWQNTSNGTETSEGFRRFYYDNTNGSGTIYHSHLIKMSGAFEPDTEYVFRVEFRNVVNSGYSFSPVVKNVSNPTVFSEPSTLNIIAKQIKEGSVHTFTRKTASDFTDIPYDLFLTATTLAGNVTDYEVRISIYPATDRGATFMAYPFLHSAAEGYLHDICNGTQLMAGHTPQTRAEHFLAIKAGYQGIPQPPVVTELDEWLARWINE